MKKILSMFLCLAFLSVFAVFASAGSIDSPASPMDPASAMYTINGLYNWLDQGATPTKRAGAFTEPASGPGSSTHTLNDLWDQVKIIGRVPKTGQTISYGTSDDGALEKGVAPPAGTARFTDNGNGTVTDNLTGLIWLTNASCFGSKAWANALTDANTLNSGECGLSDGSLEGDWRLPNVRELHSLIDYGEGDPALPSGHPFSGVQSYYYWSSTTTVVNYDDVWYVHLHHGAVYGYAKTVTCYVWPVRGGH